MPKRPSGIDSALFLLEILRRIPRKPYRLTTSEIFESMKKAGFEKDKRSVQRALKTLSEHFDDLECDDRDNEYAYCWLERSEGISVSMLNEQQALILKLAEQQLKYLLPVNIMSSMEPFFKQAEKIVGAGTSNPEHQWFGKICSVPTSQPLIPAKVKEEVFTAVSTALFQNKLLHIEYQNQTGKKHKAQIMPLAIAQQGASTYLVARYDGFEDNRLLALHRIKKAELSTFSFERPKDFNLKQYQDEGHLGFGSGGKVKLTFSITRWAGFHLTETPLSKDQITLEESEEHYRFQATVADTDMLEWWIRRFGEEIWDIEKESV